MNKTDAADKKFQTLLFIFLIAGAIFKIATAIMIATNGDNIHYWHAAMTLLKGGEYIFTDHQVMRYGIIIPVYITQLVFGTSPLVYYVSPFLMSMGAAVLVFFTGKRLHSAEAGFLAALLVVVFPESIHKAGQIMPDSFSLLYVMAAFYALLVFNDTMKSRYFLVSSLCLFGLYQTNIMYALFFPGFALIVFMIRKKFKHVMLYFGILGALFLVEFVFYYIEEGSLLGQVGVIGLDLPSHSIAMEGYVLSHAWELFKRFTTIRPHWQILLGLYMVIGCYTLFIRYNKRRAFVFIAGLSFLMGITFAVKSLDPLRPMLQFCPRHLLSVLPFAALLTAMAVVTCARMVAHKDASNNEGSLKSIAACAVLAVLVIIASCIVPAVTGIQKHGHPFKMILQYQDMVKRAEDSGVPIVVVNTTDAARGKSLRLLYDYLSLSGEYMDPNKKIERLNTTQKELYRLLSAVFHHEMVSMFEVFYVLRDDYEPASTASMISDIKGFYYIERQGHHILAVLINKGGQEGSVKRYFSDGSNPLYVLAGGTCFHISEQTVADAVGRGR